MFAEALACGTPVISCPRGALPEIVTDGKTGFLVESIDAMAAAVSRVRAIERAVCRQWAEERFSRQVITQAYVALYSKCCSALSGAT